MAATNLIIGLGHRKRVGKDTFASFLGEELEQRGYDVYRVAFAHDMKEAAHGLFDVYGLREAHHYEVNPNRREQPLEKIGKTPRQLWIEFGNAMRAIDPDIWIARVWDHIESCVLHNKMLRLSRPPAFIITDVRYPNEAEAIKAWGGRLVKIARSSVPDSDDIADNALADFPGWDHTVGNHRGIRELMDTAAVFAIHLTSKQDTK